MLAVNLTTYNLSGVYLIQILRNHQKTGTAAVGEDITGSKSASPFDIVIAKTMKSMVLLTVPSVATMLMFAVTALTQCNNQPLPPYDPTAVPWSFLAIMYVQLVMGILFTRVAWISKAALDAAIIVKVLSTPSTGSTTSSETTEQKRTVRAASRAELKERAQRMSQSPKARFSEGTPSAQNSHPDIEMQEAIVAVVVLDSAVECLPKTDIIV